MTRIDKLKKHPCISSFVLTLAILGVYSIIQGIYPFGDMTFLRKDMYHQYLPFLTEFRRHLIEGRGLGYSFDLGLGASFYALYAYYLTDPLNVLTVLVPESHVLEFMTVITYLKISLASSCMCRYLLYRNRGCSKYTACLMGLAYALSGFTAAYDWNVMWMWGIALAPLVLMGFEKAVKGESSLYYTLLMAFILITNYYIGMVICIFLVFYFFMLQADYPRDLKKFLLSGVNIALTTILAAGIASVILIPEAYALSHTGFTGINLPSDIEAYMSIPTLMSRSLLLMEPETGLIHDPNIYAGIPVLMLVSLYFSDRQIPIRQRIARGVLTVFFYLSFNLNILEYIWHGMNYPDSLPARQGFLFVINILTISAEALSRIRERGVKSIASSVGLAFLFYLICLVFERDNEHAGIETWITNALFIAAYLVIAYFMRLGKDESRRYAVYTLCLVFLLELGVNLNVTSDRNISRESYFGNVKAFKTLSDKALHDNPNNQGRFARFDDAYKNIRNESALIGYRGDSFFSSTVRKNETDFYKAFGMKASRVHYLADGITPFTSAIMGVDHILASDFRNNGTDYDIAYFRAAEDDDYLYQYLYPLPFGYTVPDGDYELSDLDGATDPIERQCLAAKSLGSDDIFHKLDISLVDEKEGETDFVAPEEGHYYAYYNGDCETLREYVDADDEPYGVFEDMDVKSIMDLGRLEGGSRVRIVTENEEDYPMLNIYRFDPVMMQHTEDLLSDESFTITDFEDDHIEGIIDISNGRDLVLTVPFDEGWDIFVDGEKAEAGDTFYGLFFKLSLPEGIHHVELSYHVPYLRTGMGMSVLSLAVLFFAYPDAGALLYSHLPGLLRRRRRDREASGNL